MVRAGLFDVRSMIYERDSVINTPLQEVAGLLIHSHITPSSVVAKAVGYKEVRT